MYRHDERAIEAHGHSMALSAKYRALATVSAAALTAAFLAAGAPTAYAQSEPAVQGAQAPATEEIVVTGSRIVRDGYEAPTPVSVVGVDQIEHSGLSQISDFVNQLPSISGSTNATGTAVSSGLQGIAALNLRDLGVNRTLVLLDGQRSVPSAVTGQVDTYNIPSQLVSRVDVVTGGASSAYGSDAIAGVVNFVLDKTFTGLKGEASGGVTTYGDDRNWKLALTGGTGFADDKGHFLISGEADYDPGILNCPRSWCSAGNKVMLNPNYTATNGQPNYLVVTNAGIDEGSPGGIITAGPLKGIEFGPGGVPRQFNYGSLTKDPYTVGGDWAETVEDTYESLASWLARQSLFTRASYDITDNVNVFVQLSWNKTFGYAYDARQYSVGNITEKSGNPFIPASVQSQMTALGITSLTMGSFLADLGPFATDNTRETNRYVFGGNGKFDALDTRWTWDGYFQSGETRASESIYNTTVKSYFTNAIDAVRGPNGQIECRSTLTNPNDGCVPFNVFGIGVNSQAAINYITNNEVGPHRNERFVEDVAAVNLHGEPFSDWAGAISIATGIEHRKEAVHDAPTDSIDTASNYFVGNFLPNEGQYSVTEGYVETVIPLLKNLPFAKSLDFNGAIRATGYSISGYVTTWKAGLTYAPVDDLHFRATRSRDIRAPNLSELFAAGTANTNSVVDPGLNNATVGYVGRAVGNTNLKPEVADTIGLGVVLQPTFLPGFSASVDYYDINMKNEIASVGAQDLVNLCYTGQTQFCSALTLGTLNGAPYFTNILLQPFNFEQVISKGIDFEGSYATPLSAIVDSWNGNIAFRILATHYLKNFTNSGIPGLIPIDTVGTNAGNGPPNWRYYATLDYSNDPIRLSLAGRGVSGGAYNNNYIVCTSGCPAATSNNETINSNSIAGAFYLDATVTYKFNFGGDKGSDSEEVFLSVRNIANKPPAVVNQGPTSDSYKAYAANDELYDMLGRVFRLGIRFKM